MNMYRGTIVFSCVWLEDAINYSIFRSDGSLSRHLHLMFWLFEIILVFLKMLLTKKYPDLFDIYMPCLAVVLQGFLLLLFFRHETNYIL